MAQNNQVTIYIPKEIYENIVVKSALEGRSINNQIIQILKDHFK